MHMDATTGADARAVIEEMLDAGRQSKAAGETLDVDYSIVIVFYKKRAGEPVWHSKTKRIGADALRAMIGESNKHEKHLG